MIGAWLAAARLCGAIVATWHVPAERACPAALAITVEHRTWSPALVAAIAWHESRFDATAVNALGCWGAMQVCGPRRRDGVVAGYRAGVRKLDQAVVDCERMASGNGPDLPAARGLDCVLRVYAAGPGWRSGGAGRSAREFRALAAELAQHLHPEAAS